MNYKIKIKEFAETTEEAMELLTTRKLRLHDGEAIAAYNDDETKAKKMVFVNIGNHIYKFIESKTINLLNKTARDNISYFTTSTTMVLFVARFLESNIGWETHNMHFSSDEKLCLIDEDDRIYVCTTAQSPCNMCFNNTFKSETLEYIDDVSKKHTEVPVFEASMNFSKMMLKKEYYSFGHGPKAPLLNVSPIAALYVKDTPLFRNYDFDNVYENSKILSAGIYYSTNGEDVKMLKTNYYKRLVLSTNERNPRAYIANATIVRMNYYGYIRSIHTIPVLIDCSTPKDGIVYADIYTIEDPYWKKELAMGYKETMPLEDLNDDKRHLIIFE